LNGLTAKCPKVLEEVMFVAICIISRSQGTTKIAQSQEKNTIEG
jgi:hypothetical protein